MHDVKILQNQQNDQCRTDQTCDKPVMHQPECPGTHVLGRPHTQEIQHDPVPIIPAMLAL
jgi:hypothetical protein